LTYIEAGVAVLFCGILALASYLHLLYVEAVRFRHREDARSFEFFDSHVEPLLKLPAEEGMRRFAMARQVVLVLLTITLVHLTLQARPFDVAVPFELAIAESVVLSITSLILFVHIVPSILFSRTRGVWALRFVPLARIISWSIRPILLLAGFAASIAELGAEDFGEKKNGAGAPGNIEVLLDAGQEEGLIGEEDRKLIQSVVEFGDKTVRQAMTPRPEIVAIEAGKSVEELRQLMIENEFSRIPVYEGTIDRVIGYVHSRNTLEIDEQERRTTPVRALMRPVPLVPETKPIHQLLREMQEQNVHMTIVIDEYGQTAGLATMEDLMEEIVGEIRDESEPELDVVEQPDHSFIAGGSVDLDRLEELVDFRPSGEFETTTIGGLVTEQLGHVPAPGAKIQFDGIEIEVLTADERRVNRVRVRRLPPAKDEASESGGLEGKSNQKGAA
jgi:CBS domain containing-hemolysin-like protein